MIKIDAVSFSWAGDKYLGRSYKEMDCQAFVEQCMADCGLKMDLGGSNSWFREVMKNGWTGTPEDCVREIGSIPKGALLFILEDVGPKTPEKFRHDGIGDVTHIGIKTGRGDGAIHSSSSKGCVATSVFKDKTIRNGGWNRVGLYNRFTYGKTVDWILNHIGIGKDPSQNGGGEEIPMEVVVWSENGGNVKMRQSTDPKSMAYALWDDIPTGTTVEVISSGDKWSRIQANGKTGWMMSEFLRTDLIPTGDNNQDLSPPGDVILVNRARLEKLYDELGDILGLRG